MINSWIKEKNNIYNNANNIKNNTNIYNVSDWPKRSPFEFYNKNLIVPNKEKEQRDIPLNKNEKLKQINDDVNQIITKKNINKKENTPIKVSLHSHNKKTKNGSITIQPTSQEEKQEDIYISNNLDIDQRSNNNEEKEKEELYDFNYTKDGRIKPLILSLNKKPISGIEENDSELRNIINKKDVNNIVSDQKQDDNANEDINIEQYVFKENVKEKKKIKIPKILILPKSKKEIAYYKDKDLFDEEIKEHNLNITHSQMNFLENELDKIFNKYKESYEHKTFEIKHPYLEYDYYKKKYKDKFYLNYKIKERLYNMLQKQKVIIHNISRKKNNIFNHNYINNKYIKNKSSLNEYELNPEKKKSLLRKVFKSFSTSDYYSDNNWEKRQQMLESKKEYSTIIFINERRNMEERRKAKLIKKLRRIEERKKMYENNLEDDEYVYDNEYQNGNILPSINQRGFREENIEENRGNTYKQLRNYKFKQNEGEKIVNSMMKYNPKMEQLLYSPDLYKMKV